jgi:hypothetical protein
MEIFSSREIAIGFWLAVFILWALWYRPTRFAAANVLRAAAKPKLIVPVITGAVLTFAIAWFLHRIRLWTQAELKDTIVWFLFTGVALTFRGVNPPNPSRVVRNIIHDAIKATVLVEFVVSTYTFSLSIELLLLPVATLLALLLAVANTDKQYALAESFINKIQFCLGATVMAAIGWSLVHDFRKAWSIDSARQILLPILLTLAFIPLAYLMALFAAYEQLFLPFVIHKTPFWPKVYCKTRLLVQLRFSLRRILIARQRLWTTIGKICTKAEAIRELSLLSTEIPAPPPIDVDIVSYQAGYAAGFASASLRGDARIEMHRQLEADIETHGYDLDSFDRGFSAGTQDADLEA